MLNCSEKLARRLKTAKTVRMGFEDKVNPNKALEAATI